MNDETLIDTLISQMQGFDHSQLARSLRVYLKDQIFGDIRVHTVLEPHRFIAEVFSRCDTALQEKIREAFSDVLEAFEGTNPQDDAETLFYLTSLASVIRTGRTRQRLRRWIRNGTFDTWKHAIFHLNSELILASASYDADEEWSDFMLKVLPSRSSFKDSALAVYRALWQARGQECLSILPDVILVLDLKTGTFAKSLGYLLRLTIDKIGVEQFSRSLIAVIDNMQRAVDDVWVIIVRIEEILEQELVMYRDELQPLVQHFASAWNRAAATWQNLPQPKKYEAFDRLLEEPQKDWENIRITSPRVVAAFMFRKKYILEITEEDHYIRERCEQFFEDIGFEKERGYMVATAGQG